jgi:hypothetical protein
MESTFDALNPGHFASFTEEKIRLIKQKYIRIAIVVGISGLVIGAILMNEYNKMENEYFDCK